MLEVSLRSLAREVLEECKWNSDKAFDSLVKRLESDKAIRGQVIHEAAMTVIRNVESEQRTRLHAGKNSAPMPYTRHVGKDNTLGLEVIANGWFETYVLLGNVKLGDAKRPDVEAFVHHHQSIIKTSTERVMFGKKILASSKFKAGKRLRDCLSEMEIARLAGELKC